MQQERSYLDKIIIQSEYDFQTSSDYNERLMEKINKQTLKNETKNSSFIANRTAAISFILSGVLIFIINTTSIQYRILDFRGKVKTEVMTFQYEYNYKLDIVKNVIGEWY